jgi:hypothetical protein
MGARGSWVSWSASVDVAISRGATLQRVQCGLGLRGLPKVCKLLLVRERIDGRDALRAFAVHNDGVVETPHNLRSDWRSAVELLNEDESIVAGQGAFDAYLAHRRIVCQPAAPAIFANADAIADATHMRILSADAIADATHMRILSASAPRPRCGARGAHVQAQGRAGLE